MPKKYRLRLKWLIQKVMQKGKIIKTPFFVCRYLESKKSWPQFCIVISSKIHKSAVQRNKIKRRISEAIRKHLSSDLKPFNMVILVHKTVIEAKYAEIEQEIGKILKTG